MGDVPGAGPGGAAAEGGMSPSEKAARLRSMKQDFCRCGTYRCIINTDRDALEAGAEAIEARASDPVRAALAEVWDLLVECAAEEWRTPTQRAALRVLADAAKEASDA